MKKINNWSIAGILAGVIFSIISTIRYWAMYPDLDKFLAYLTTGILIIAVSFLYENQRKLNYTLDALEEHLADKEMSPPVAKLKKLIEEKGVEFNEPN